ncbi:unnamed protein product [Miscanthus lutarioriparius]|uniref:Uncharacterized protein n=1 Tax=Miscanthus lutarioriparius TaxID=422564 RepID=A0A811NCJ4_9POAL|nr:unnamed protein product [Miscanthus lutarioriparius]
MQGGRSASAVEAAKEAAANVGASAWAGKEKTKAVVQEKVSKTREHDPAEKAATDARMQERVHEVEAIKQDARRQNAAAKERATAAEHHPTPLGVGAAASVTAPAAGAGAGAPVATTETGVAAEPAGGAGVQRYAGFHGTDGVPPPTGTAGGHYT